MATPALQFSSQLSTPNAITSTPFNPHPVARDSFSLIKAVTENNSPRVNVLHIKSEKGAERVGDKVRRTVVKKMKKLRNKSRVDPKANMRKRGNEF
jgi:hypothetical protein